MYFNCPISTSTTGIITLNKWSQFSSQVQSYMQHFGLPTRLLDVTTNALVALYFACQSHLDSEGYETDGIVTMFISNKTQNIDNYTYYSSRSDTVEVLSTLALMDEVKKKAIYDSDKKVSLHNVEDEPIRLVISGENKQKILKELD
ncbi:hypothetical protein LAP9571_02887 [Lactiplantibacillus plantarum]|uniref:FRG domain-containing protein n=1 Tax=Lactiplantibacillus plantarum TaxID=1590 RepID=UPI0010B736CD|nr:FRG domain-containing protein [Lactiplantibacillus plantarum]VFI63678.1 hypothetical protein LAP9571_02887 [Lactiplantibacillus plantarum]VFI64320.1 hypothetical protein LAP9492_03055 [Lactiplantibacillus plantarum]